MRFFCGYLALGCSGSVAELVEAIRAIEVTEAREPPLPLNRSFYHPTKQT